MVIAATGSCAVTSLSLWALESLSRDELLAVRSIRRRLLLGLPCSPLLSLLDWLASSCSTSELSIMKLSLLSRSRRIVPRSGWIATTRHKRDRW